MAPNENSSSSAAGDHFALPKPVVKVIGKTEQLLSSHLVVQYWPVILKFLEWSGVFFLSYFGFGYGWILFFVSVYYLTNRHQELAAIQTKLTRLTALRRRREAEVLAETLEAFPSWVAFPDFDRLEWVNEILAQLWSNVDCYATLFVKTFIEPKLHDILDLMQLDQVSGFTIKRVDLGTIPARLNGIKVYDKKHMGSNGEEVLIDCDVAYDGDARVVFALHGISAQINNIKFRGMARIHLKPLIKRFPFVGGFEFYFLNTPKLEYSLGGIGTFGDAPGAYDLVRSIVQDKIRARFVWPNRFKLYFPLPEYQFFAKWSYMLPKPAGLLSVQLKEARNLLKKDKHFGGSGKSDPYAVVSVGERKMSFRNAYAPKTVDPIWNYSTSFLMENPTGQNLKIEVYDFDSGSSGDFLGVTSVSLPSVLEKGEVEKWVSLGEVKHGDIHLACQWKPAKVIEDEAKVKAVIASVFVDGCTGLQGGNGNGSCSIYPRLKISLNGRPDDEFVTLPKTKTENPSFEQGWMMTSQNPLEDEVRVQVLDAKNGDACLGKISVGLNFILDLPNQEFFDMEFPLEGNGHSNARISISAKLYAI